MRGFYQYVNPAFAEAMGRQAEQMIGIDDTALFGYDTAKRLEVSDHWVLENKQPKNFTIELYIQSKLHHLNISKVPFIDQTGKMTGIVSLFRDITEFVRVRKKSEKATRQTIETLVKAIEKTDPYLSGHSDLMRRIAHAVAGELNLDEQETATIQIAANLSQIGKMLISKELLNKPGKLTPEERHEVERHVEHAASLLKDVEFDLPITECVLQINELVDGSGYPKGIKGDAKHDGQGPGSGQRLLRHGQAQGLPGLHDSREGSLHPGPVRRKIRHRSRAVPGERRTVCAGRENIGIEWEQ